MLARVQKMLFKKGLVPRTLSWTSCRLKCRLRNDLIDDGWISDYSQLFGFQLHPLVLICSVLKVHTILTGFLSLCIYPSPMHRSFCVGIIKLEAMGSTSIRPGAESSPYSSKAYGCKALWSIKTCSDSFFFLSCDTCQESWKKWGHFKEMEWGIHSHGSRGKNKL
jgi:hypothetical protein